MNASEQARADATVYRCLECELDISRKTRPWHVAQGHPTVGPVDGDSDQSRLDADSDASALRMMAADVSVHCYGRWDGPTCKPCDQAVLALRIYGPEREPLFNHGALMFWNYTPEDAAQGACDAFRAVPGLRGAA